MFCSEVTIDRQETQFWLQAISQWFQFVLAPVSSVIGHCSCLKHHDFSQSGFQLLAYSKLYDYTIVEAVKPIVVVAWTLFFCLLLFPYIINWPSSLSTRAKFHQLDQELLVIVFKQTMQCGASSHTKGQYYEDSFGIFLSGLKWHWI